MNQMIRLLQLSRTIPAVVRISLALLCSLQQAWAQSAARDSLIDRQEIWEQTMHAAEAPGFIKQNPHQLESKYQTSQKEKEIAQQQLAIAHHMLEIQKKRSFIFLTVAALLLLVLVLMIFYLLYRNKQKAAAERLRSMERESELKVLLAMMEDEEKERSRLAHQLHDRVGQTLAAAKMHLSLLWNKMGIPEEATTILEKSAGMLDSAAQEIRSISHNLSPEIQQHYNLATAIHNLCETVTNEGLQVDFYSLGESMPLKKNFTLIIYRIVQELVRNILKHAEASHVLVQLSQHDQLLSLTVEDNGRGFAAKESSGIGLAKLQARVKEMGGLLTIESEAGKGSTIYIEFEASPFLEKKILVSTVL